MADTFTLEESRKLAVLIARAWRDPRLAERYRTDPEAVLAGAGIDLGRRAAPELPEMPSDVATEPMRGGAEFASASSFSTISCPCTGCTASCAGPPSAHEAMKGETVEAILKLAEDPEGRAAARKLTATWGVTLDVRR